MWSDFTGADAASEIIQWASRVVFFHRSVLFGGNDRPSPSSCPWPKRLIVLCLRKKNGTGVSVTGWAFWINTFIWVTQVVPPSLWASWGPYQLLPDSFTKKEERKKTQSHSVSATEHNRQRAKTTVFFLPGLSWIPVASEKALMWSRVVILIL